MRGQVANMEPTRLNGWQALRNQPWLLALAGWLPPLMTLLFIAVFEMGTLNRCPWA